MYTLGDTHRVPHLHPAIFRILDAAGTSPCNSSIQTGNDFHLAKAFHPPFTIAHGAITIARHEDRDTVLAINDVQLERRGVQQWQRPCRINRHPF